MKNIHFLPLLFLLLHFEKNKTTLTAPFHHRHLRGGKKKSFNNFQQKTGSGRR